MAAKDDARPRRPATDRAATREALAGETADLLYHALVLLAERGRRPGAIGALGVRHASADSGASADLPADLPAALADPDVEPLPGDRLRDERRVGRPACR